MAAPPDPSPDPPSDAAILAGHVPVPPLPPTPPDARKLLPDPLDVRLISVADVRLPMLPGHHAWLDNFYCRILACEPVLPGTEDQPRTARPLPSLIAPRPDLPRLPGYESADLPPLPPAGPRIYRTESFLVRYEPVDTLHPEQLKLVQFQVPSLDLIAKRLLDRQLPYERFRGLTPGLVHLQVVDPIGHVLQVFQGSTLPL